MSARARFASGVGALSAAAVYLVTTTTRAGVLYYLPSRGAWTLEPPSGVIAMDWYYRSNATIAACVVGTAVAWRFARADAPWLARAARGVWVLAATMLAWSAGYTALWLVSAM